MIEVDRDLKKSVKVDDYIGSEGWHEPQREGSNPEPIKTTEEAFEWCRKHSAVIDFKMPELDGSLWVTLTAPFGNEVYGYQEANEWGCLVRLVNHIRRWIPDESGESNALSHLQCRISSLSEWLREEVGREDLRREDEARKKEEEK